MGDMEIPPPRKPTYQNITVLTFDPIPKKEENVVKEKKKGRSRSTGRARPPPRPIPAVETTVQTVDLSQVQVVDAQTTISSSNQLQADISTINFPHWTESVVIDGPQAEALEQELTVAQEAVVTQSGYVTVGHEATSTQPNYVTIGLEATSSQPNYVTVGLDSTVTQPNYVTVAQDLTASQSNYVTAEEAAEAAEKQPYVSVAWKYFTKILPTGGGMCKFCLTAVDHKCSKDGHDRTSEYLWRHLKQNHTEAFNDCQKALVKAKQEKEMEMQQRALNEAEHFVPASSDRSNGSLARPYFEFVEEKLGYHCKLCGSEIKCRFDPKDGSEKTTTDFWRHLKRQHIDIYNGCKKSLADRKASDSNSFHLLSAPTTKQNPAASYDILTNPLPSGTEYTINLNIPSSNENNNVYSDFEQYETPFHDDDDNGDYAANIEIQTKKNTSKANKKKYNSKPLEEKVNSSITRPYFHYVEEDNGYICKLCGDALKCRFDPKMRYEKTTTDFWRHLKRKHQEQYDYCKKALAENQASLFSPGVSYEVVVSSGGKDMDILDVIINDCNQAKTNPTVDTTVTSSTSAPLETSSKGAELGPIRSFNRRQDKIDALVLQMITTDLESCSFITSAGFCDVLKALDPMYDIPSYKKLTEELLPRAYDAVKRDVKLFLRVAEMVAITGETWVAWNGDKYVTLTAHFYSPAIYKQKAVVLSTVKFSQFDYVEELAALLQNIFVQWELEGKICVAITDDTSASILAGAMESLGIQHIPCLEKFLSKSVERTYKSSTEIITLVTKVKTIAGFFNSSMDGVKILRELGSSRTKLKLSVNHDEKKWTSALALFRSYIKHHETISTALCLLSKTEDSITESEVGTMKKMIEILEVFQLAIEELKNKKSATLSVIIPLLKQLNECLSKIHFQSFSFSDALLADIDQLLQSVNDNFFVMVATILDPCFKEKPLANDPEKVKNVETWLLSKLGELYSQSAVVNEDGTIEKVNHSESNPAPELEMKRYYARNQPRRHECHPLTWWENNEVYFPNLIRLAKQFMAMPGTVFSASPVFTMDDVNFLKKRSYIDEEFIDTILFMHQNYENVQQVI